MSSIVVKVGGPSVATTERIQQVAKRIIKERESGKDIVVVCSGMGRKHKELVHLAAEITDDPSKREMDILLSTSSQVTSALFAMALQEEGQPAIVWTGAQAGVLTDAVHRHARIESVDKERYVKAFAKGEIVVVAGMQGADATGEITTLGKGGAETTAVAIAAAIGSERVEIYTNVDGIYTGDPNYIEHARKLKELSYDEMLELANLGSHILHPRAVELAKKYEVPVIVRSSLVEDEGTLLKEEVEMERDLIVRGIAFEADIIRLTVGYDAYSDNSLADIFTTLAEHRINVDIIVQAVLDEIKPTVSFSISKEEFADALRVLESSKVSLGFSFADFEIGLAKVSIVGSGMVSNPGVAARMFDRLRREKIQVKMVSTSEIKVSVVVPQDDMIRAANALHDEFNLAEKLLA